MIPERKYTFPLFTITGDQSGQHQQQPLLQNDPEEVPEDDDLLLAACQEWETSASHLPGISAVTMANQRPVNSMVRSSSPSPKKWGQNYKSTTILLAQLP